VTECPATAEPTDSLHEGLGSHRHEGSTRATEGDQPARRVSFGCGRGSCLGNVELTDGALWARGVCALRFAGVLLDFRGARGHFFFEGSTSFVATIVNSTLPNTS